MRAARESRGLTQTALAQAVGCSVTQISRIESGERTTPRAKLLESLADELALSRIQLYLCSRILPAALVNELTKPVYALAIGDGHALPRETGWLLRRRHIALLVADTFEEPQRPPVSPTALARWQGLDITVEEGEAWAAIEDGRIVARGDSDPSRRFAAAHALGHFILEETPVCDWGSMSQGELEANAFAAYLLLPPRLLRTAVYSVVLPALDLWSDGVGPLLAAAAARCGVPTWLLARRVTEDGILAELVEVGDL